MTVIDFEKEKRKRKEMEDNSIETNQHIYYVVSQKNKDGVLIGYNTSFIRVPNHPFSTLDIPTLKYLNDETLKVVQELDKDVDSIVIINVISMGIESPENNCSKWNKNND